MKTQLLYGSSMLCCFSIVACGGMTEFDREQTEQRRQAVSGTYTLKAMHSGKCIDVTDWSTANGTILQQWDCNPNGQTNQNWIITDTGNGKHQIQSVHSGKCMDVKDWSTSNGGRIQQWDCNPSPQNNQLFWLVDRGNSEYGLQSVHSAKCVDVVDVSTNSGAQLQQWDCFYGGNQRFRATLAAGGGGPGIAGIVSSGTFDTMFPNRIAFYTYSALVSAGNGSPAFVNSSDLTLRKREAAAFLANIDHESDHLRAVREYNTANWCNYCDWSRPFGCPAGQCQYYGRGPMQLSWNYNYKATGDALGVDLLNNPDRVATDATIAWRTAVHYWMTNNGPNTMTAHTGITCTDSWCGFGQTIRSINGALECDGRQPATVEVRVSKYRQFCDLLGVSYGNNLYC